MDKIVAFTRRRWAALGATGFVVVTAVACSVPPCGFGPARCF